MQGWLARIRDLTGQGIRVARVRVVNVALTDYSRFGMWCAQVTNGAGEDMRYLTQRCEERFAVPASVLNLNLAHGASA